MPAPPGLLLQEKRLGGRTSIVIEVLDQRSCLHGVAKIALVNGLPSERLLREAQAMTRLAPAVLASGADIPAASVVQLRGGCPAILQSPLEGRRMDVLLARGTMTLTAFTSRLTDWLERWNQRTRKTRTVDRHWLEEEVLAPAEAIAPRLTGGAAYLGRLRSLCAGVQGQAVPLVATHCDLTTSNVLDGPKGRLAIVDWESAQDEGLPLRDLVYGLVDAAWVSDGRGSRVRAFAECFEADGRYRDITRRSEARIRRALGLSDEFAALCFQACWLQHATDEAATRMGTDPEPFLEIVEQLARQHHE